MTVYGQGLRHCTFLYILLAASNLKPMYSDLVKRKIIILYIGNSKIVLTSDQLTHGFDKVIKDSLLSIILLIIFHLLIHPEAESPIISGMPGFKCGGHPEAEKIPSFLGFKNKKSISG